MNNKSAPAKRLFVMSGPSGCGKSTIAQQIRQACGERRALVISTDDFFMVDGEYRFVPAQLPEAHGDCFLRVLSALREGTCDVVVDNTNTSAVEIAPYMLAAQAYGYAAEVVEVGGVSVETCAARNTHGVPLATIERMAKSMAERQLPPWWKVVQVNGPIKPWATQACKCGEPATVSRPPLSWAGEDERPTLALCEACDEWKQDNFAETMQASVDHASAWGE